MYVENIGGVKTTPLVKTTPWLISERTVLEYVVLKFGM